MPGENCRPVICASIVDIDPLLLRRNGTLAHSCSKELKNDKVAAPEEREVERGLLHFEQKSARFSLTKAAVLMGPLLKIYKLL